MAIKAPSNFSEMVNAHFKYLISFRMVRVRLSFYFEFLFNDFLNTDCFWGGYFPFYKMNALSFCFFFSSIFLFSKAYLFILDYPTPTTLDKTLEHSL